jgi:LuxR family maltose regulon positive regulatory protein
MATSLFFLDNPYGDESFDIRDTHMAAAFPAPEVQHDEVHILWEKLRVPETGPLVPRPRLNELLGKSVQQYSATLVTGRAGTGKTALAADFVSGQENLVWYTIVSSDVDWNSFSRHFTAGIMEALNKKSRIPVVVSKGSGNSPLEIPQLLVDIFAKTETVLKDEPLVIVLDDLHRVFDAAWFGDFFNLLLHSLPLNVHLLMLCRGKPPAPLWRLRSKQVLNVIDENLLAFSPAETSELFGRLELPEKLVAASQAASLGRISKLLQFAGKGRV